MRRKILILSFLSLTFSIFAQEYSLKTRTRPRWGKSEMHSSNHNQFAATMLPCRHWITVSDTIQTTGSAVSRPTIIRNCHVK